MKRVLVLNRSINQGGIDDVGLEVAKYLCKSHEVLLAVFFNPHSLSFDGLTVKTIEVGPSGTKLAKIVNVYKRFRGFQNLRREFKPDVVIAQGNQPDILVALDSKFFGSYKTILTVHNQFSRDNNWLEKLVFRLIANWPNFWVAVSSEVEGDFKKNFGARNVRFITNPVRALEPTKEKQEGRFIFSAGRLEKQKDFATLIKAFSILNKKQRDLKLVISGTGTLKNNLESLVESLGLKQKVMFTGHIPNIYAYIKGCEIFVSSSIYEGTPITVLQALDLGRAVVATDIVGTRHAVGEAGLYSPVGDEKALAANIEKVLQDSTLRAKLEKNAHLQAEKFSMLKLGKNWDQLLVEVGV